MKKFVIIPFNRFESEIRPLLETPPENCHKSTPQITLADDQTTQIESKPATSQGHLEPEAVNKDTTDEQISKTDFDPTENRRSDNETPSTENISGNELLKTPKRKRKVIFRKLSRVKASLDNGRKDKPLWLEP